MDVCDDYEALEKFNTLCAQHKGLREVIDLDIAISKWAKLLGIVTITPADSGQLPDEEV